MKLELKKLKINNRASEETTAFAADLWVDGAFAAKVGNAGRGGSCFWLFEDRELRARVEEFCDTLPAIETECGAVPMCLDFALARLADGDAL